MYIFIWYFHFKDKTVVSLFYLYNLYTGKMASLYWDGPHGVFHDRENKRDFFLYKMLGELK